MNDTAKTLIRECIELLSSTEYSQENINLAISKINETIEIINNNVTTYEHVLVSPFTYTNYIEGYFPSISDGELYPQSGYKSTDYVDVSSMHDIEIYKSYGYHVCCFYDIDKKFIKGLDANSYTEGTKIEITDDIKYIRLQSGSDGTLPTVIGYSNIKPEEKVFIHESDKEYVVINVANMKTADYRTGDVVETLGYYTDGDFGNAIYDIMTEDEYVTKIKDLSFIPGAATQVDNYGDHLLNNGLVAKMRIDHDDMRPEQWGAKGDGITNDCPALVHMFGKITTGTVTFRQGCTYLLDIYGGTYADVEDNPYRTFACGGLLGGQYFSKPILTYAYDLNLVGNNCLITVPDNGFGKSGMGLLNLCGHLKNVDISGFNFDNKGRTMYAANNKNSNHTIFYNGMDVNNMSKKFQIFHPHYTKGMKTNCIENLNIHDNYFYDAGAMYRTAGDCGGDFILIVNPMESDGIYIENNRFEAWGRWVFSIDLLGGGEVVKNVNFNNNICIGANAHGWEFEEDGTTAKPYTLEYKGVGNSSDEDYWRWRALGWIDFESKKCFENVNIKNNFVDGTTGFAINGASRVSSNIVVEGNEWIHVGGGYPYKFEFYSGIAKDIVFNNNKMFGANGIKMGYFTDGATITNNIGGVYRTFGIAGNIIFDNNKSFEDLSQGCGINWSHEANNYDANYLTYEQAVEKGISVRFTNNTGGYYGSFSNFETGKMHHDIVFDIRDNVFTSGKSYNFGNSSYTITNEQINYDYLGDFIPNGARFKTPITHRSMAGGIYYFEKGDIMFKNVETYEVVGGYFWKNNLVDNFTDYNGGHWGAYSERNGITTIEVVCTKSGYYPSASEYGLTGQCCHVSYLIDNGRILESYAYVWTDDYLYYSDNGGTLQTIPTHNSGMMTVNGVRLYYIGEICRAELNEQ